MDPFTITILVIVATTLLASYLKRITKDRCLKNFEGYIVTLFLSDDARYCGKLDVESTGMEVIFQESAREGNLVKMSHILYKDEYPLLLWMLRYHDQLTARGVKRRDKALKKTYHPTVLMKMRRKTINFFKLIKDSLMEIMGILSGRLKTANPGAMVVENERYAGRVSQELVNTIDATFDPLLEKYIGNVVCLQMKQKDGLINLSGILKEYTQHFIELLDMRDEQGRCYDAVIPRRLCHVRGLGESAESYSIFSMDFNIRKYKRFFSKINTAMKNNGTKQEK
ncbi:MAG: hypothetical protein R6W96_00090 [Clostridia bacterium]